MQTIFLPSFGLYLFLTVQELIDCSLCRRLIFCPVVCNGGDLGLVQLCTQHFWDGVNTEEIHETCWYDDFRPSDMKPAEFIKFIDYYKNPMNIKYERNWKNHYRRIFITSIFDPHEMYSNVPEETREQWIRRMRIIHMERPFN